MVSNDAKVIRSKIKNLNSDSWARTEVASRARTGSREHLYGFKVRTDARNRRIRDLCNLLRTIRSRTAPTEQSRHPKTEKRIELDPGLGQRSSPSDLSMHFYVMRVKQASAKEGAGKGGKGRFSVEMVRSRYRPPRYIMDGRSFLSFPRYQKGAVAIVASRTCISARSDRRWLAIAPLPIPKVRREGSAVSQVQPEAPGSCRKIR